MPMQLPWPLTPSITQTRRWQFGHRVVMGLAGIFIKVVGEKMNRMHVYNKEILEQAVENRPKGTPLVTVCNHTSCMDDPILFCMLKFRTLTRDTHLLKWTFAAHDICFTRPFHSWFFSRGRIVPVVRGDGVYQYAMNWMLQKLNAGEWVHTFPEGRINMDTSEFLRLKWGVGRLIAESEKLPIVIPFWHVGMNDLLPVTKPYIPRVGKDVTVLIGKPIDFTDLIASLKHKSPRETRKAITDVIQNEFRQLREAAEELHERVTHRSSVSNSVPLEENQKL